MRGDHERICNEVQLKYKHKMSTLRIRMENDRKRRIKKIEDQKTAKIKEVIAKHDKKYTDIKDYYFEITSTNLDIIKFLKEELSTSKAEEAISQKEHTKNYRVNKNVTEPLFRAKAQRVELKKK